MVYILNLQIPVMVGSDYKEDYLICKIASGEIQPQDLTVCPYLNLKHGKLGHLAGFGIQMFYLKYSGNPNSEHSNNGNIRIPNYL